MRRYILYIKRILFISQEIKNEILSIITRNFAFLARKEAQIS